MWLAKKEKVTSGIVIGWNQIHIRFSSHGLEHTWTKKRVYMSCNDYNNICIIVLDNKEFDN